MSSAKPVIEFQRECSDLLRQVYEGRLTSQQFEYRCADILRRQVQRMHFAQISESVHFLASMNLMACIVSNSNQDEIARAFKILARCGFCNGKELALLAEEIFLAMQNDLHPCDIKRQKLLMLIFKIMEGFSQECRTSVRRLKAVRKDTP